MIVTENCTCQSSNLGEYKSITLSHTHTTTHTLLVQNVPLRISSPRHKHKQPCALYWWWWWWWRWRKMSQTHLARHLCHTASANCSPHNKRGERRERGGVVKTYPSVLSSSSSPPPFPPSVCYNRGWLPFPAPLLLFTSVTLCSPV